MTLESFDYEAVILDIEGTTTPITFVSDVLFPYILQNLKDFLYENKNSIELKGHIEALLQQSKLDHEEKLIDFSIENIDDFDQIEKYIQWQMSINRKHKVLKNFQGFMWRSGYQSGLLQGIIYDDVLTCFKKWKSLNIPVYIYSSGSVEAQKLLFQNTKYGNLLPFIKDHFDTSNIGNKLETESYRKIKKWIGKDKILFISDSLLELKAAKEAGIQVLWSIRPGNPPGENVDNFLPYQISLQ